ncbi:hypothetical protein JTE90_020539 [Oedothorax gibbosus]|uniref:Uncharacterized protein n=1 Tax=Oedothorax gibbosus TaxID=931172 RepID=A0AAV6VWD0_9ARAC|nr:hypothetical protein JTE90_020539 [Oedothorax gibbosus]
MPPPKRLEELLAMTLDGEANQAITDKDLKNKRKDVQEKRMAREKEKLPAILKDKKKKEYLNKTEGKGPLKCPNRVFPEPIVLTKMIWF